MHMLTDIATWERLKGMGIQEWIQEKLDSGQIRNIGFSYHGNADMFCRLADAYPWNFCQIQYNYMDENTQAGRKGLLYAAEKGLPVIVMEPLRGGRLVNLLPQEAKEAIEKAGQTPAGLAFRWLWDQPQVTVVLSGMNSRQMVKENTVMAAGSHPGMGGRGRAGTDPAGEGANQRKGKDRLHRLRLLYALPPRGGHSRLLQKL